jgi:hypothetical protein
VNASKRIVTAGAVIGLVAGAALMGAPSASAALPVPDWVVVTDCQGDAVLTGQAQPGDIVEIQMTAECGVLVNINSRYSGGGPGASAGFFEDPIAIVSADSDGADAWTEVTGNDWYVYGDQTGATAVFATLRATDGVGNPLAAGSIVAGIGPFGVVPFALIYGSGSGSGLPMWQQGYGRASADAACDSGWGASWAQWPNGGKGGWVCVREVPALG